MDSKALKPWRAKAITQALYPPTNYLVRLRKRMEALGFPPSDELYRATCAAHDAMVHLRTTAHYLGCSGVGAPTSFGYGPLRKS